MTYDEFQASEEKPEKKKKNAKRKRSPSPPPKGRKGKSKSSKKSKNEEEEEEDDLTADMEDPPAENNISEVKTEMQPAKGSTYMDIDENAAGRKILLVDLLKHTYFIGKLRLIANIGGFY